MRAGIRSGMKGMPLGVEGDAGGEAKRLGGGAGSVIVFSGGFEFLPGARGLHRR